MRMEIQHPCLGLGYFKVPHTHGSARSYHCGFAEVTRWLSCLPLLILLRPLLTGVLWEHFPTSGSASEELNLRQTSDLELIK